MDLFKTLILLFCLLFIACTSNNTTENTLEDVENGSIIEEGSVENPLQKSSSSSVVGQKPVVDEEPSDVVIADTIPASSSSFELNFDVSSPVIFTEVDPVNVSWKDHEGDDPAWVEIYNPADTAVNLSDFYLTKSRDKLTKWRFGDVIVGPKSFLVVYLSDKDLPDYVAPHDSINMVGSGIWGWADEDAEPIAGTSFVAPNEFSSYKQKGEDGKYAFSAKMQFGQNEELGWHSASLFVGTKSGDKKDPIDISKTNELLLTGFVGQGISMEIRLAQPDLDDWKGYEMKLEGTGESETTYRIPLPASSDFPDLSKIYGTRFAPSSNEMSLVKFTFTSYVARNRGHEPHTNFKIKNEGGSLYLTDGKNVLDSVLFPVLPPNKTWALDEDNQWGFADATPSAPPTGFIYNTQVNAITLPESGFFSEAFTLLYPEVETGVKVRCETGGSMPTAKSPLFGESMTINKTTVLRCASFKSGELPSEIVSRTYIFEEKPSIAAVFLTGDPGSLFDPDTGIYLEGPNAAAADPHFGANYWLDKEIPAFVEFFEPYSATPDFSANVGFEIFGNYSRANAKKSTAIVFREKYGQKNLQYTVFPDYPELTKFKWLVFRNNGGNFSAEYIRDRLASTMSRGLGVDYQKGRFAIVYYNGEYYGIHSIRERSNKYYFETNYDLDAEHIDLLKAGNDASSGSPLDYTSLISYLETNGAANDKDYEFIQSKMDVENFINYMHTELFANNRDWPSNNLKKWRSNTPATKWKWFLYDLDFGMGNSYSEFKNNIFEFATTEEGESWPNGPESTFLLRTLLKNDEFKAAFINRFSVLLATKFSADTLSKLANSMYSEISSEISRDQKRWNHNVSYMNDEKNKTFSFIKTRQETVLKEMQEFFELGEIIPVELSAKGNGSILVHNLKLSRNPVTVQFFAGFPVTITAMANGGGVFSQWSDGVKEPTRTIDPELVDELVAEFK